MQTLTFAKNLIMLHAFQADTGQPQRGNHDAGKLGPDEFQQIESSFTPLQGNLPVNGNLPFSPIDPTTFIPALQQVRWPLSLIADNSGLALQRLFVLPGSHYDDQPVFAPCRQPRRAATTVCLMSW